MGLMPRTVGLKSRRASAIARMVEKIESISHLGPDLVSTDHKVKEYRHLKDASSLVTLIKSLHQRLSLSLSFSIQLHNRWDYFEQMGLGFFRAEYAGI